MICFICKEYLAVEEFEQSGTNHLSGEPICDSCERKTNIF